MKFEITAPVAPENLYQWFIDLLKRILEDVFGFIAKEEGWDK